MNAANRFCYGNSFFWTFFYYYCHTDGLGLHLIIAGFSANFNARYASVGGYM